MEQGFASVLLYWTLYFFVWDHLNLLFATAIPWKTAEMLAVFQAFVMSVSHPSDPSHQFGLATDGWMAQQRLVWVPFRYLYYISPGNYGLKALASAEVTVRPPVASIYGNTTASIRASWDLENPEFYQTGLWIYALVCAVLFGLTSLKFDSNV